MMVRIFRHAEIGALAFLAALFLAGSAQALSITAASVGAGQGCFDSTCTDPRLTVSSSDSGTGSITLTGFSATFSFTIPTVTMVPISGPDDNGVTSLVFSSVTYSGTATGFTAGPVFVITGGSAAISGTQTPSPVGTAGPFAIANSLLGGSCTDLGGSVTCGIVFSPNTDFNFDVNGQTRYFTHTVNLTAVPEPGSAFLFGMGLVSLGMMRRRGAA